MAKDLNAEIREKYISVLMNMLSDAGEECLRYKSGEFSMPCVDSEGNEKFVQIVVKIPKGSRDGEPFDGYVEAENYEHLLKEKALKKEKANALKQKKIERDRKYRERQKELKAKRGAE